MSEDSLLVDEPTRKYTFRDIFTVRAYRIGGAILLFVFLIFLFYFFVHHNSSKSTKPECSSHNHCSSNQACIYNKCVDPCRGICGINATCRIQNHTAGCACREGYTGDAFSECKPIIKDPQFECTSHSMCLWKHACVQNQCVDPCIGSCATNATCTVVKHEVRCSCPDGYNGNASVECKPDIKECKYNGMCPDNNACERGKCVDPCDGRCAKNATCTVESHEATCTCPKGFTGSGDIECRPIIKNPSVLKGLGPYPPSAKKRYEFEKDIKGNWYDAFSHCLRRGGRLATINNKEENNMINKEIENTVGKYVQTSEAQFWTSATNFAEVDDYVWMSTGQPMTFSNWIEAGQDDYTEDCMIIGKYDGEWRWDDKGCFQRYYIICEYHEP